MDLEKLVFGSSDVAVEVSNSGLEFLGIVNIVDFTHVPRALKIIDTSHWLSLAISLSSPTSSMCVYWFVLVAVNAAVVVAAAVVAVAGC
eukprot:3354540-Amphidinium_carterae.1